MGYFHTSPDGTKIYIGSAKVSIADYVANYLLAVWHPLGILSAFAVTPKVTTSQPDAVNGKHKKYVTDETHSIALSMQEHDENILKKCMGDLTTIEAVTGSPVAGHNQDVAIGAKAKGEFIPFEHQNYAGGVLGVPTAITVVQDPLGTPVTLVLNTDYIVMKNEFGTYGIVPTNSGAWDATKLNRITFTFLPQSQIIIHQGGKTQIAQKMVKIEHEEADGRTFSVIYYLVEFSEGGGINFKKDGGAELIDFNVTMEASNDRTKDAGKQLYRMIKSA